MHAFMSTFWPDGLQHGIVPVTVPKIDDPFLFDFSHIDDKRQHRAQFYKRYVQYNGVMDEFNAKYGQEWVWHKIFDNLNSKL